MKIEPFSNGDVEVFLGLACQEGWICDPWEFEFLGRVFPEGSLVARVEGLAVGFVTCVKYERSGWIGNLLVRREARGRRVGQRLMEAALDVLEGVAVQTVWLTASAAGRPIYEGLGFSEVDTIKRWVGKGTGGRVPSPSSLTLAEMARLDQSGWGDCRESILEAIAARGEIAGCSDGFLVRQPCGKSLQLGPWWSSNRETAARLLGDALGAAGPDVKVFLDVPVRNVAAAALLFATGFSIKGRNSLMYRGDRPDYHPEQIYALASMGSMG